MLLTLYQACHTALPQPELDIPFSRDPKFVGHEDVIQAIDTEFTVHSHIALVGLRSIGYTARQYNGTDCH